MTTEGVARDAVIGPWCAAAARLRIAVRLARALVVRNARVHWTWQPASKSYVAPDGTVLSADQVAELLKAAPYMLLVTADLPPNTAAPPLLRSVVIEGQEDQLATATNGQTQTFVFHGSTFQPGMWVLVDGVPYRELEVIDPGTARITEDPVNAAGPYYVISVLNPGGLASNEFPIPVLGAPSGPTPTFKPPPREGVSLP